MLTIEQFAKAIDRTVPTVRFWLKRGEIQRKVFSGRLYFTEADVELAEDIKKEMKMSLNKGMKWN